ncbi:MAG: hypothetical protein RIE32_07190 [Phycisphaerales bacterium]
MHISTNPDQSTRVLSDALRTISVSLNPFVLVQLNKYQTGKAAPRTPEDRRAHHLMHELAALPLREAHDSVAVALRTCSGIAASCLDVEDREILSEFFSKAFRLLSDTIVLVDTTSDALDVQQISTLGQRAGVLDFHLRLKYGLQSQGSCPPVEAPIDTISRRDATWFRNATGDDHFPSKLRVAISRGHLRDSRKIGGCTTWQHSISEVCQRFSEYEDAIEAALEADRKRHTMRTA